MVAFSRPLGLLSCFLAWSVSEAAAHAVRIPGTGSNSTGHDTLGAVASESSICSGIGKDMLLRGGSAADALVGTVFCVGVIGMYHSGIGGGGFMLVRDSNGTYEFIDFRETAPAAAFQDMYNNDTDLSLYSGLARYISIVFFFCACT